MVTMLTYYLGPDLIPSGPPERLCERETGRVWGVTERTVSAWGDQVDEVVVGYCERTELSFLKDLPNVKSVWIKTPTVTDLSALPTLPLLTRLAIDRPTCRMDILGELQSLEELYIDDWRPGAQSLFRLRNLRRLGIQKYGQPDLTGLKELTRLEDLWINAGKLERLDGIPESICKLRITSNRRLSSLLPLRSCPRLDDLRLESVRQLHSLEGVENCPLKILVLISIGQLADVEPLREKQTLEFLTLGGVDATSKLEALYSLRGVQTLNVPGKARLQAERMAPGTNIRLCW